MPKYSLTDNELEILHLRAVFENRRAREKKIRALAEIDAGQLLYLVNEVREKRRLKKLRFKKGKIGAVSDFTQRLMNMKEGESIFVDPMPKSTLCGARKTARKQLGLVDGDDCVWHSQFHSRTGKLEIRRGQFTTLTEKLASMEVGEVIITMPTDTKALSSESKNEARIRLKEPKANWKYTKLANGSFKIKRAA
jgi:hypothetical protein